MEHRAALYDDRKLVEYPGHFGCGGRSGGALLCAAFGSAAGGSPGMTEIAWAAHAGPNGTYWQILPLIVVVSIVYSATRHESWSLIWRRSLRLTVFIIVFMSVTLGILWGLQTL